MNDLIIGVDPGRSTGVAVIDTQGVFISAWVITAPKKLKTQESIIDHHIANDKVGHPRARINWYFEYPVIYQKLQQKGDPNHLVKLALLTGALAGAWANGASDSRTFLTPQQWKGSTPKSINHARTLKRCPDAVDAINKITKTQQEHVIDALGIALYGLKEQNEKL